MMRLLLLAALGAALLTGPAKSATIYVDLRATGAGTGISWSHAYTDISSALTAAQPGDQVWVRQGMYRLYGPVLAQGGVALLGGFAGYESTAEERNPAEYPTFIVGLSDGIEFHGSWESDTVVDGFRFGPSPGRALLLDTGGGTAIVSHNVFYRLNAWNHRAPLEVTGYGTAKVNNNLFVACSGQDADTVGGETGTFEFTNNTVARNGFGGAETSTRAGGVISVVAAATAVANNIFQDNSAELKVTGDYAFTQNITHLTPTGSLYSYLDSDAQFVDAAAFDFHTRTSSPARDQGDYGYAGASDKDLDYRNRIDGGAPDIGAYEASFTTRLAFEVQPQGANSGGIFGIQPVVVARAPDGSVDDSFTGEVTIELLAGSGTGSGHLDGTSTVIAVNGRATFSDLAINTEVSSYFVLVARSSPIASAVSLPFRSAYRRIHISPTGDDTLNDGLSWAMPLKTVARAAQEADWRFANGEEVQVWLKEGTYSAATYLGSGISLHGGFAGTETELNQRPGLPVETRLVSLQAHQSVLYTQGAWTVTIERVNISDYIGTSPWNGAINAYGPTTVRDCVFTGNRTPQRGACVYGGGGQMARKVTLEGNVFSTNVVGSDGGAVASDSGDIRLLIEGNTFSGNTAGLRGGAVAMSHSYGSQFGAVLRGNTFVGNTSVSGGAVAVYYAGAFFEGNTFTSNIAKGTASQPDGLGGAVSVKGSSAPVRLAGNTYTSNRASAHTPGNGQGVGGDIAVSEHYDLTLSGETSNQASADLGGSVSVDRTYTPGIHGCRFIDAEASDRGGAVYIDRCAGAEIRSNVFSGCLAGSAGAAIRMERTPRNDTYWSETLIWNSTIYATSSPGGAVSIAEHSRVEAENNVVTGGTGSGFVVDSTSTSTFRNNDVWGVAPAYTGVSDPTGSNGNIAADPMFTSPAAGDFALMAGSPCIDAGISIRPEYAADTDLLGAPRVQGPGVDIGAIESNGTATARVRLFYVSSVKAGVPFNAYAYVRLPNGNYAPYNGPVTVSLLPGTGTSGAALSGTTTQNATNGYVSFPGLSIDKPGVSYRLLGSAPGYSSEASYEFDIYGASIVRVSPNGSDSQDGSSWSQAKRSLYNAMQQIPYDTPGEIWAAAGTYYGGTWVDRPVALYGGFNGTETSRDQRNIRSNETVIDAFHADTVIQVVAYDVEAAVDGFTLINGAGYWGGVWAGWSGTGFTSLRNNTIRGSATEYFGGAVTIAQGILANNIITDNSGGGPLVVVSATGPVRVVNNLIARNTTTSATYPSAVFIDNTSATPVEFTNNTVVGNSGGDSVLYVQGSATLTNNVVSGNGKGITLYSATDPGIVLSHNNVWGNTGWDYEPVAADPGAANGNLKANPLFVNAAGGNYRLSAGSPSINAGLPSVVIPGNVDLDFAPRVFGSAIDMGAYEFAGGPAGFTLADVRSALGIAAGLASASPADVSRLDVAPAGSPDGRLTLTDAARIARKVGGKDTNP